MSALSVHPPFPIYTDRNGEPLEDGLVYIGTAGVNPETNPIAVYWDVDLTIPAAQPIRTLAGFPARYGSPSRLYVNANDYSTTVRDKTGKLVYSSLNLTERISGDVITGISASKVNVTQVGTGAVERTAEEKFQELVITPQDFGAVGDGSADDAAAITKAVTAAISTGRRLVGRGTYRVDSQVNFRYANVDFESATINVNHSSGPGIIIGGNASNANNPRQMFGAVNRTAGSDSQATPTVRAIGLKGQYVGVQRTTYFQLYADDSAGVYGTDYSSAYSTLWLKYVNTIELLSAAGTTGWINENQFFLNRCFTILISNGNYGHNHNKFHNGTMEGTGVITVAVGKSNIFEGFRFERNPSNPAETLTVTFGSSTWNNHIQATWQSSRGYVNDPYGGASLVSVADNGWGNTVNHVNQEKMDEVKLIDLSAGTPFVSSVNKNITGLLRYNTDLEGVRWIKHQLDNKFKLLGSFAHVYDSPSELIPVEKGDFIRFDSDIQAWRPSLYLYDANRKLITSEPVSAPVAGANTTWISSAYYYSALANVKEWGVTFIDTSVVKFVRLVIRSGGSATGQVFSYLRATVRQPRRYTGGNLPRPYFGITEPKRKPSLMYFNDSDVDMKEVGANIPCYSTSLGAMKMNVIRSRHLVTAKADNVLTVAPGGQFVDAVNAKLVYMDSTGAEVELAISSAYNNSITLTANAPSDLSVGSPVVYLLTKSKTLT